MNSQNEEDVEFRACRGADTIVHQRGEHMEECRICGMQVRADLTDHPFFGFRAGCMSPGATVE